MSHLAIVYEHDQWLRPLFAELDRRRTDYRAIHADGMVFDPGNPAPPAHLIFNRVAMSSFLRSPDHPIFFAQSLFAAWEAAGARIVNGPRALAIDASKARQLSLIASLGHAIPATRVVHRVADLAAAASELEFPIVVKGNIGGSGAGIMRFDSPEQLSDLAAEKMVPESIDKVWLVQDYVPARGDRIIRFEVLDGKMLYALSIDGGGSFDLCPADACRADLERPAISIERADPEPALIAAAERIVASAGIDVGGVEAMIDDRDGVARFYDINAFSNFVADPLTVLGWDPHQRLIDWLEQQQQECPR
ncbi:MAG: alpha-L-glutamate ligase [Pseudomonadota bacterium]|nr:alpha-L-glutamate ligase [Pseudomonadota bacterium]